MTSAGADSPIAFPNSETVTAIDRRFRMASTPSKDYKRLEREQRKRDKKRAREEAKAEKLRLAEEEKRKAAEEAEQSEAEEE